MAILEVVGAPTSIPAMALHGTIVQRRINTGVTGNLRSLLLAALSNAYLVRDVLDAENGL